MWVFVVVIQLGRWDDDPKLGCYGMRTCHRKNENIIDTFLDIGNTVAALKKHTRGAISVKARAVGTALNDALRFAGCETDSSDEDVSEYLKCAPPTRQTPTRPYTFDPITLLEHTLT